MRKQEQLDGEAKMIHSSNDAKQLAGFFLLLFTVSQRQRKKDKGILGNKQVDNTENS